MTMDPGLARMALRQSALPEVYSLLAYIEGYALVIGSLGVRLVPTVIARQAVKAVIDGRRPWQPSARTFAAQLRVVAREEMAERLDIEARSRALMPGDDAIGSMRLAVAQVGDLTGVEAFAHSAAELMPYMRIGDPALIDASVKLADELRRRLATIAPADDLATAHTFLSAGPFAKRQAVPRINDDEHTAPRRAPQAVPRSDVDKTPREKP
jgi:hypothetical protein